MFGRGKRKGTTQRLVNERNAELRAQQLLEDPSSIPGMTQTELNAVINTGTIPVNLLGEILNY